MKLEVKENMYVRTKDGIIDKILKLNKSYVKGVSQKDELYAYDIDNIVKASYNIIDILEVGDILVDDTNRKLEILLIDNELMVRNAGLIYDNNYYLPIKSIAIKSAITHEQMEQMKYKVGSKDDNTTKNE